MLRSIDCRRIRPEYACPLFGYRFLDIFYSTTRTQYSQGVLGRQGRHSRWGLCIVAAQTPWTTLREKEEEEVEEGTKGCGRATKEWVCVSCLFEYAVVLG